MKQQDILKQKAARRAVEMVTSGMVVGLGSGSTAQFALQRIAERLNSGDLENILGIPSSTRTAELARELGIPLTGFDAHPAIDLTIDGADEVDPHLNVIKGGGGALLREKVLAQASRRVTLIIDESKLSPQLGTRWPLPVEVIPFAARLEEAYLCSLGARVKLRTRENGNPWLTDQGNFILDADFGPLKELTRLDELLNRRAGIVEHGLFLQLADAVVVAAPKEVRLLEVKKHSK